MLNDTRKESEMTEMVKRLSDETLANLNSVESAMAALGIQSVDELEWNSNVYTLLTDKSKLVGKKFLAVQWNFHQSSEYVDAEFVSVYIITADPIDGETRFIFNDGSTGVYSQLKALTSKRQLEKHVSPNGGALVKNGLKLSQYDRFDEAGKALGTGKTYYLAN